MAFTFDASPLSPTMNSYVDVTFADDYFISKFGAEAWASFELVKKQALLVTSTNRLDIFSYGGLRTSRDQPLQWPRQGIYSDDGYRYSPLACPANLKKATCEMAFWLFTEEDRMASDTTLQQLESLKAGPLDLKIAKNPLLLPLAVTNLIKSIGSGTLLSDGYNRAQSLNMHL